LLALRLPVPTICLPGIPDLLSLHAANPRRYPFLLQTPAASGWDILFAFPQQTFLHSVADLRRQDSSFFSLLDAQWRGESGHSEFPDLPFSGGWFVYLGYELLHELEPSVRPRYMDSSFPLAGVSRIPAAILVDRANQRTILMAESGFDGCLATLRSDIAVAHDVSPHPLDVTQLTEEDEAIFLDGVSRIKRYITEGDVFQVNLSRQWQARLDRSGTSANLYANLRRYNPAPFGGIADFGQCQIVSSSPERLVRVRDGQVETRPIAGTHPRSSVAGEDDELRRSLAAHPKERAEHIMLVDLGRNDVGRVSESGSVQVHEMMHIEKYSHVIHIVSNVDGKLRKKCDLFDAFFSCFPAGTLSGAPKIRAMEIIDELERVKRGLYGGALGYIDFSGRMDTCIVIRTIVYHNGTALIQAGAGIVADSVPSREYDETVAKATALFTAIAQAGRIVG
jgi:anthranilate synthase component 1